MPETEHFVNDGTGWECRRCRAEVKDEAAPVDGPGRFFREGEAEGGGPRLSSTARASWADAERTTLRCPRCAAEERVGREKFS
jgi:ribosomal protein L37AE/L43A